MPDNNKNKFSKEFEFILLCNRQKLESKNHVRLLELADAEMNWERVYEISLQNRVFPLVYHFIKQHFSKKVPENFLKNLKSVYSKNAAKNLYLSVFLIKTIEFLKEHDIFVLPFKGPLMAQNIFGNLELRCFSDLDILVPQNQAVKAWILLEQNDFSPVLSLKNNQKKKYIKTEDHIAFTKSNVCIELHWEMSGRYLSRPLGFDQISKEIEYIPLLNKKTPNLKPEYLLVYLCVHGAKHGWENIEQIGCISAILGKNIDWPKVKSLAAKWECEKMLAMGLYLSNRLYGKEAPDFMVKEMDENLLFLSQGTLYRLMGLPNERDPNKSINRFSLFHFKIRDNSKDKLRYLLRLIFSPTDKEWFNYPVPACLSWCHFLLRPLRLSMERLGK